MNYIKLENLTAYRFFEKEEGPITTIRNFTLEEAMVLGHKKGIVNMKTIYNNRERLENLLRDMFKRQEGQPQTNFPYYAAVFDKLPPETQLYARFKNPEFVKIPMIAFQKDRVSFTYGRSTKALTRKDGHPTHRKLYLWDEAEWIINKFPFDIDEELWLEMQIWEKDTLCRYYAGGKGENVHALKVFGRLDDSEYISTINEYKTFFDMIKEETFLEPHSSHGIAHAQRVLVLSQELANLYGVDNHYKELLRYCAAFHDIGRIAQGKDDYHGFNSFKKIIQMNLLPQCLADDSREIIRFIVENHQLNIDVAQNRLKNYQIKDKKFIFSLYCIFKDADILDCCRYSQIIRSYLCYEESRSLIDYAYQLLRIIR